jgi:methionine-gamma-lyase
MDKHSSNAMSVAEYLTQHPRVSQVNYPGLPAHPAHALATRQMKNYGGMLSFEIKGELEDAVNFMRKLNFCILAPTLGDVDTLILHPATMSHINIDREIRYQQGITDSLVRISVGIEDAKDIIADLEQALA